MPVAPTSLRDAVEQALSLTPTREQARSWTESHSAARLAPHRRALLGLADANAMVSLPHPPFAVSAFELACANHHEPLALALIEHGFDWRKAELSRFDPVHGAAEFSGRAVELLAQAGAPLDQPAPGGRAYDGMPLHKAAGHACPAALRALLERGCDPNAVAPGSDGNQFTALHMLARGGFAVSPQAIDCVQILREFGADLSAQDDWGMTPLHWAFSNGAEALGAELIRQGAPWLAGRSGDSPFDAAFSGYQSAEDDNSPWPRAPFGSAQDDHFHTPTADAALEKLRSLWARVERDALQEGTASGKAAASARPGPRL
jgi:hypothetical protein